jgi:mRNA interferase MazF
MEIKQYRIVLVNLEYSPGGEIRKTRPCVVISPDEMNRHLRTIVVAPMTTRSRNYPTRVRMRHDQKTGWIVVDQIRAIDRRRIIRDLGPLSQSVISKLKEVLRETYVD